MNTVLDDSMTLCLSNGERVKLKPEMKMLFEVNKNLFYNIITDFKFLFFNL